MGSSSNGQGYRVSVTESPEELVTLSYWADVTDVHHEICAAGMKDTED